MSFVEHVDARGTFVEMFRQEWDGIAEPFIQWNLVRSTANVVRGVHVHPRHADYLILVNGRMTIGLKDLRAGSPTEGAVSVVVLEQSSPSALIVPPGVAHGFFFDVPSIHAYAVTQYWNPADELGCHWQDPELGIPWPIAREQAHSVRLSPRDEALPPLSALAGLIPRWSSE